MLKYKVIGDIKSNPWHSSRIIIDSLNRAAKEMGVYDENGIQVNYSVIGETFNLKTDAFISVYELSYPRLIINNFQNKPVLGVSRDNHSFILDGGYPSNKCSWFPLGVDSNVWRPVKRTKFNDKIVVLISGESNVRSCYPESIHIFGQLFKGKRDIILYLRDRNATDLFKKYVKEQAAFWDIEIIHDDRHIENFEEQVEIFTNSDIHLHLNRSSTWNMPILQGMACEVATIALEYSGSREYCQSRLNSLCPSYNIDYIKQDDLIKLESIGLKNHLFPINDQNYANPPYWANPSIEGAKNCLRGLVENKELRIGIAYRGKITAEGLSWQKSAILLSYELERLLN